MLADVVVGAVVDEDTAQRRVVLPGERLERLLEPRTGGVSDDDGDDRRGADCARSLSSFAVHGALRLPLLVRTARHHVVIISTTFREI